MWKKGDLSSPGTVSRTCIHISLSLVYFVFSRAVTFKPVCTLVLSWLHKNHLRELIDSWALVSRGKGSCG
jgi:hypothetical protein